MTAQALGITWEKWVSVPEPERARLVAKQLWLPANMKEYRRYDQHTAVTLRSSSAPACSCVLLRLTECCRVVPCAVLSSEVISGRKKKW